MTESRREFLTHTAAGIVGAAAASRAVAEASASAPEPQPTPVAGTPPAFGTAPPVGPEITAATVAEAEKLVRVELTPTDRAQVAGNWSKSMAPTMERRTGPRKIALEPTLAPATLWNPMIPGVPALPARDRFIRSAPDRRPLPTRDEDIAFASVADLSLWIQSRTLTSERLTRI